MTTTEQILTTFTAKVDMEKEYTRSELAKMLTEVFKEMKEVEKGEKPKKKKVKKTEDGEEKKKRAPTAYNLFVKDTMGVVKEENPEMSRQDLMREVGRMWKEKKGEVVNEEDVKEEEVVANEEMLDDKKGKKGKKEKNVM
jgi:hypothetical protein